MIQYLRTVRSLQVTWSHIHTVRIARRGLHGGQLRLADGFTKLSSAAKYQIYVSSSHDPYLNLSVEHHLLQNSPPSSTILFLYINRPCVVIGRNQNPWLEINLGALKPDRTDPEHLLSAKCGGTGSTVDLVRRRSGGGTVFHDLGNVNYSVICSPASFTRDKHACMVTQAIRTLNPRARVNKRHDIVLDQGQDARALTTSQHEQGYHARRDCHTSGYETEAAKALKVSGSAYKLTRTRALHHGTCLVCSPMVGRLSGFLTSPAVGHIRARGVDSVRSPVGNVLDSSNEQGGTAASTESFQRAVIEHFCRMYSIELPWTTITGMLSKAAQQKPWLEQVDNDLVTGIVGDDLAEVDNIRDGIEELKSQDWIFGQTPLFTLSTHLSQLGDKQNTADTAHDISETIDDMLINITARNGKILTAELRFPHIIESMSGTSIEESAEQVFEDALVGTKIHEVESWQDLLIGAKPLRHIEPLEKAANWLDRTLAHQSV